MAPEDSHVALEAAGMNDTGGDDVRPRIPETRRLQRKISTQSAVSGEPVSSTRDPEECTQFDVVQPAEGGYSKSETGQLGGAAVDGYDLRRIEREQRQDVVSRGGNRE